MGDHLQRRPSKAAPDRSDSRRKVEKQGGSPHAPRASTIEVERSDLDRSRSPDRPSSARRSSLSGPGIKKIISFDDLVNDVTSAKAVSRSSSVSSQEAPVHTPMVVLDSATSFPDADLLLASFAADGSSSESVQDAMSNLRKHSTMDSGQLMPSPIPSSGHTSVPISRNNSQQSLPGSPPLSARQSISKEGTVSVKRESIKSPPNVSDGDEEKSQRKAPSLTEFYRECRHRFQHISHRRQSLAFIE